MGQKNGVFSKDELEEYTELTYLSRGEVLKAYSKFSSIDPNKLAQNRHAKISCDKVRNSTEELKLNPFGDRICSVFRYLKENKISVSYFLIILGSKVRLSFIENYSVFLVHAKMKPCLSTTTSICTVHCQNKPQEMSKLRMPFVYMILMEMVS